MGSPGAADPPATARSRIHVLAHDPATLQPVRHMLRLLTVTGWPTTVTTWTPPVDDLGPVRVRLADPPPPRRAGLARSRLGSLVGRRPPVVDPGTVPTAAFDADLLVCLDSDVAHGVRTRAGDTPPRLAGADALAAAVVQELAGRPVVKEGDAPALDEVFAVLPAHRVDPDRARAVGRALMEGSRWQTLLAYAAWLRPTAAPDSVDAAILDGYQTLAELGLGRVPNDLTDRAGRLVGAARRASDTDDDAASLLLALTLRALFHRSLHVAVDSSPLIEEPERFLAPLRGWPGLGLANPQPVDATAVRGPSGHPPARTAAPPIAVLLPGAYPNFAGDLARLLSGSHHVERVELGDIDSRFRNTEVEPATLERIRRASARGPGAIDGTDLAAAVATWREADLVVADWADKGAALASLTVAPHTRLVVRVLGVDTLSAWIHAIDWGRVDAVIFVSAHLQAAARGILGSRLTGVEQYVVPHTVEVSAFAAEKSAAAEHTLGMVGWAQSVKDPLWTLEVLAGLREHDPGWRLRLIGADFPARPTPAEADYADRFRAALDRPEVRGAVELTGFLGPADLAAAFGDIGYAISSSRRESWHIGAMELTASGALPVIRDWPLYSRLHGAAGVFGPDAVVATPAEGVRRILSFGAGSMEAATWAVERARVRELVRERYSPQVVTPMLREALLGPRPAGGQDHGNR